MTWHHSVFDSICGYVCHEQIPHRKISLCTKTEDVHVQYIYFLVGGFNPLKILVKLDIFLQ